MIKTHKVENMNMSKMSYGKHVACVRGQDVNVKDKTVSVKISIK